MYKVKVNGKAVTLPAGKLLPALRGAGYRVPSVCWHADVEHSGGRCRVCVCQVNGRIGTPCNMPVTEGMDIVTDSPQLNDDRAAAFALIPHIHGKYSGPAQYTEELEERTRKLPKLPGQETAGMTYEGLPIDFKNNKSYVISHPDKCVHCGLCVQMCQQIQGLGAIADMRKPHKPPKNPDEAGGVGNFHNSSLFLSECVSCGQCINVCPYGALEELPEVDQVEALLKDESVVKVVQFAPAVRVALAEEFGAAPGERIVTKEMVGALRKIAKNTYIYDTNFTADLTIVEEGAELLERLRRTLTKTRHFGKDNDHMPIELPMITSCSPGWVLFAEKNYHDLLPNLSTCKSPQQMHGAMTKRYWAQKEGFDWKKIKAISVMPCVAKKAEKDRPEFKTEGIPDIDHVLTTREFAKLLKKNDINLLEAPKEEFDHAFGLGTGAGMIFGATGGVMEAALRTAYHIVTGRDVPFKDLDILPVRGMEGVKKRVIEIRNVKPEWSFLEGVDLSIAVAHGISNARKLMDRIRERKDQGLPPEFHFVEVMCCPGGCLGGGGQPKPTNMDIKKKRGALIYKEAASLPLHRSHDNPRIIEAYRDFLGEIGGHKAHEYLHTHYHPRTAASLSLLDNDMAKDLQATILSKWPRTRARLTNLLSEVVDKYGYISDAAVVAIATHVRTTPVDIDSVISHYHFFPRHKPPQSMVYLCECPNCRLNGSRDVKHWLKANNIPYHMASWLGWCVNGAPAVMVKHVGDPQVHAMFNVKPNDERFQNLSQVNNPMPKLNYKVLPATRLPGNTAGISILAEQDINAARETVKRMTAKVFAQTGEQIIQQIKESGLRGCGGAGFPSHIKWNSVRSEPVPPGGKWIVINADEGLPSTFKDYHLMESPACRLRMMAGVAVGAYVTGATNALIYLRYEYKNLKPLLEQTFEELKQLVPGMPQFSFEVVLGGGPYVCGEETALFESVEGHLPQARVERTIFPTHHGVFGQPTLVSNVETFSWVTQIMDKGVGAFTANRTVMDQVGLKLLSVGGAVAQPVLGEFRMGSSVESILKETLGYDISEVAAAEVGGMLENLIFPDTDFHRIVSLDNKGDHLSAGGSVVVWRKDNFNERYIYEAKGKFTNVESCQLCVPCREGSMAFRNSVRSLFEGTLMEAHNEPQRKRLEDMANAMEHSSNCGHGKACGKMARQLISHLGSPSHKMHPSTGQGFKAPTSPHSPSKAPVAYTPPHDEVSTVC
jgi:NADP-reducing hydrogenase subunit HndD